MKRKKYKVYIVGDDSQPEKDNCRQKFFDAKFDLLKMGFDVINPLDVYLKEKCTSFDARRKALLELATCDAIYILSDCKNNNSNTELNIASYLNLLVIHEKMILPIAK